MRLQIALAVSILALAATGSAQDVRNTDFKNFSYPWAGIHGWADHLEWLDISGSARVHLTNGRWAEPANPELGDQSNRPFAGLTLKSIDFGDVTGDGRDEAIVTIRYDSGGTQFFYFVYIYASKAGHVSLLAYFHAGDRANSGLYRVYAQNKRLVVELFDPEKQIGDCCSSGFVRTRYHWHSGKFEVEGETERGTAQSPSRLPVSPFGIHH